MLFGADEIPLDVVGGSRFTGRLANCQDNLALVVPDVRVCTITMQNRLMNRVSFIQGFREISSR
jgi:hypothetical protein